MQIALPHPPSRPAPKWRLDGTALLLAAVASSLMHAVFLLGWPNPPAGSSRSAHQQSMQVRVLSVDSAKPLDALSKSLSLSPVEKQVTPSQNPVGAAVTATPALEQSGQAGKATNGPVAKLEDTGKMPPPSAEGSGNQAQKSAATAAPAGLPPAPSYHAAGELDPPPAPLADIEPVYPESAGIREGSVVIRILISAEGIVDDVSVVRSFPKGYFEQSAIEAFGQAKFSPGMIRGKPVKSQITIEVKYTPVNRGGAVSGGN